MSKRREKSNERAQIVCRELRYQLATNGSWDSRRLTDLVLRWMKTTHGVAVNTAWRRWRKLGWPLLQAVGAEPRQ